MNAFDRNSGLEGAPIGGVPFAARRVSAGVGGRREAGGQVQSYPVHLSLQTGAILADKDGEFILGSNQLRFNGLISAAYDKPAIGPDFALEHTAATASAIYIRWTHS
jgi:hypothetical protein